MCTDNAQTDRQAHIQRNSFVLGWQSSRCVRTSAPSIMSEAAKPASRHVYIKFMAFPSKMETCIIDIVSDNKTVMKVIHESQSGKSTENPEVSPIYYKEMDI